MVQKFTSILYELIVEKGLPLKDSFELISERKNDLLGKTCSYLLNLILQGTSLSSALRKCPYINFDNIYMTFINYGEKTGNLKETIDFLNKRCLRKKENRFKVIQASVYPCFVMFLSIIFMFLLNYYSHITISKNMVFSSILLLLICICIFICLKKYIGENKTYEAFLGIGFLLKAGISIYDAVGCGALIVGENTKEGIMFQKAREKLLFGMDLHQSFSFEKKYSAALYYAEKSGGKIDVFEKLAKWIGDDDEKNRKICFSLIEPVFILITGLFLIIFVSNIFMPFISKMPGV